MERKYKLVSPLGLNARIASLIVGVFNRFSNNDIVVRYNGENADGKSILSLITLVVKSQEELTSSSSDLLINKYGVKSLLVPALKFYDEEAFYNALEYVEETENG